MDNTKPKLEPKRIGIDNRRTELNHHRVSVIIIFLNGEAFLSEAIESVFAQSFDDWELILVDDGSLPAATTIAKEYATAHPKRVRYLEHEGHVNRGMSASRNLGIRHARGEFIALLDADDVWLPSKLATHMAILDEHPKIVLTCGATIYWNSWSGGEDELVPTGHRQDAVIFPPDASLAVYPLGRATPPTFSDVVFRSDIAQRLGGFEDSFTGFYEDQVFLSKIYLAAPVYFCSAPSNKYRLHPNSCSAEVRRAGTYHQARLRFLEWFEQYLTSKPNTDRRVISSLHHALRRYRNPRIHFVLSIPERVCRRCLRLCKWLGRWVLQQM